jgi:hypothetical protein
MSSGRQHGFRRAGFRTFSSRMTISRLTVSPDGQTHIATVHSGLSIG